MRWCLHAGWRQAAWVVLSVWLLSLALICAPARAAAPLLLDDAQGEVEAWPALSLRSDPAGALDLAQALRDPGAWSAPRTPWANLGPRRDVVWLRLPLQVRSGDGRWMLDVDYPPLQEVGVTLLRDGVVQDRWTLGAAQPFAQRPVASRSHAAELALVPGARYELVLRVRTLSAMLVPIRLVKPEVFRAHEDRVQVVQGLLTGIALALLAYSLGHWIALRNSLFGWYALMLLGTSTFFLHLSGLYQQHVWGDLSGILAKLSPLAVLLALLGGARFVALALAVDRHGGWLHRALQGMAALSLAGFVAAASPWVDYRDAQVIATVLGPVLMALAVPAAWQAARRREPAAAYMLVGWTTYAVGALVMAGLLRGALPLNLVTQHVFQAGWLLEVLAWLRVLGLHTAALRRGAERSAVEKRTLERLAATDALTGLPNRRGLQAALAQALPQARAGSALALYLIDLDGFKPVNDRLGHAAGDALLAQVGQRLSAQLRPGDVVARLGGDEFVVLALAIRDEAQAVAFGQVLLDAFDAPFAIEGHACRIGLTLGLAIAPHDGLEASALLRLADDAMYAGKQDGRACLRRAARPSAAAPAVDHPPAPAGAPARPRATA